jgi:ribosome-associated protein
MLARPTGGRPSDLGPSAAPLRQNGGMQRIDFELDRDHVALNDLLHLTGIAGTGGMGKAIVAAGDVFVDGVQELRKTAKIRAGQTVRVDTYEIRVR